MLDVLSGGIGGWHFPLIAGVLGSLMGYCAWRWGWVRDDPWRWRGDGPQVMPIVLATLGALAVATAVAANLDILTTKAGPGASAASGRSSNDAAVDPYARRAPGQSRASVWSRMTERQRWRYRVSTFGVCVLPALAASIGTALALGRVNGEYVPERDLNWDYDHPRWSGPR